MLQLDFFLQLRLDLIRSRMRSIVVPALMMMLEGSSWLKAGDQLRSDSSSIQSMLLSGFP